MRAQRQEDCRPVFMNAQGDLDSLYSLGPNVLISEAGVGPDEGQGLFHFSLPVTVRQPSHTCLWRVISLVSLPGPR